MSKVFVKQSLFSLFSQGFPALVGILVIPFLIKNLGNERFAFLTLAWASIGYFSVFDLGISRVLTKLIAESFKTNRKYSKALLHVAFKTTLVLGFITTPLFLLAGNKLISDIFMVTPELRQEFLTAFFIFFSGAPIFLLFGVLKGSIDGAGFVQKGNAIQLLSTLLSFILPALALSLKFHGLIAVVISLLIGRGVVFLWSAVETYKIFGDIALDTHKVSLKIFFSQGFWITLSNLISPIMAQLDRFFVGSLVPMNLVAFYTTPQEIVARLWLVPSAITRISYITFASSNDDQERLKSSFAISWKLIYLILLPVCLLLMAFSNEILSLWINPEFASHTYLNLQFLLLGILLNSLNWVNYSFLQTTNFLWVTAIIPIVELFFYVFLFYFLTKYFSINGAALTWSIRLIVDFYICSIFIHKKFSGLRGQTTKMMLSGLAYLAFGLLVILTENMGTKIIELGLFSGLFVFIFYRYFFEPNEKKFIVKLFKKI